MKVDMPEVSPMLLSIEQIVERAFVHTTDRSVFDSEGPLPVPMSQYLQRWMKYTRATMSECIGAVALIDRLCMKTGLEVTRDNFARLLLGSLLVMQKMTNDEPFENMYYAKVGGVNRKELISIERNFLQRLGWDVFVSADLVTVYHGAFAADSPDALS
eukprot:Hpha_TRINITY_DN11684_c0_g1::TRINITY_DN11684_c0_g1_i1::g.49307::m.49307